MKKKKHFYLLARESFWVGFGGGIGTLLRQSVNQIVPYFTDPLSLFTATFFENISGSFLIGILYTLLSARSPENRTMNLFLLTGIIGSYTTYSGFMVESIGLLDESLLAFSFYFASQIGCGILAVMAGIYLSKKSLLFFKR